MSGDAIATTASTSRRSMAARSSRRNATKSGRRGASSRYGKGAHAGGGAVSRRDAFPDCVAVAPAPRSPDAGTAWDTTPIVHSHANTAAAPTRFHEDICLRDTCGHAVFQPSGASDASRVGVTWRTRDEALRPQQLQSPPKNLAGIGILRITERPFHGRRRQDVRQFTDDFGAHLTLLRRYRDRGERSRGRAVVSPHLRSNAAAASGFVHRGMPCAEWRAGRQRSPRRCLVSGRVRPTWPTGSAASRRSISRSFSHASHSQSKSESPVT